MIRSDKPRDEMRWVARSACSEERVIVSIVHLGWIVAARIEREPQPVPVGKDGEMHYE